MNHIKSTTWPEILAAWEAREKEKWGWEAHYKEKGYTSWADWRAKYTAPFRLNERDWELVKIDHPSEFLPNIFPGGFQGWKRYGGGTGIRMKELAAHDDVMQNGKIADILAHPPKEATIILFACGGDYLLFEGMHRVSAYVRSVLDGSPLPMSFTAAVTHFSEDERDLFERAKTDIATAPRIVDCRKGDECKWISRYAREFVNSRTNVRDLFASRDCHGLKASQ